MNWDEYFMSIARAVAQRSKDRSTKVGCVIVGPDHEIRSTGYNGFVRGMPDDNDALHERPEKYFWTEHAERNALYAAVRVGTPLAGCTAYVDWLPCIDCARGLVQSGIVAVVVPKGIHFDDIPAQWKETFKRAFDLFALKGIPVRVV